MGQRTIQVEDLDGCSAENTGSSRRCYHMIDYVIYCNGAVDCSEVDHLDCRLFYIISQVAPNKLPDRASQQFRLSFAIPLLKLYIHYTLGCDRYFRL